MDNISDFELPNDSDKLSSRFILESVRKKFLSPRTDVLEFTDDQVHENIPESTEGIQGEEIVEDVSDVSEIVEAEEASAIEAITPLECSEVHEEQCGTEAPPPTLDEIEPEPENPTPLAPLDLPHDKKYFRVSEVSEIIGVEPYVLRYWQSEFSTIKPFKSSSGHWVYSRRDVENLHLIRHLLHIEKYSIKGAKRKLRERKSLLKSLTPEQDTKTTDFLKSLVRDIKDLTHL